MIVLSFVDWIAIMYSDPTKISLEATNQEDHDFVGNKFDIPPSCAPFLFCRIAMEIGRSGELRLLVALLLL